MNWREAVMHFVEFCKSVVWISAGLWILALWLAGGIWFLSQVFEAFLTWHEQRR